MRSSSLMSSVGFASRQEMESDTARIGLRAAIVLESWSAGSYCEVSLLESFHDERWDDVEL